MKKFTTIILMLCMVFVFAACGEADTNNKEEDTSNDNGFFNLFSKPDNEYIDESDDDISSNRNEENPGVEPEQYSNWVDFDKCFYGEYSQELPFDNGTDANGNTIWGSYDGHLKITKDYIYIDVPEGQFELTPENSRVIGDEIISVIPLDEMAEEWRFIFHNKANLQAGYKYISMQTATNQYTLNKE